MAIFLTIVLSIWAAMHAYVFWRLAAVPWVAAHLPRRALWAIALTLAASYPLGRWLDSRELTGPAWPLEFLGANWIGVVFLLFCSFLAADVVTLFGWALPRYAAQVRAGAAGLAVLLALIGLVQGLRKPVVRQYEVFLPGLPPERDGFALVVVSDMHLGSLIGKRWMTDLVSRVEELKPDAVVVAGDLVDGNVGRVEPLRPVLEQLRAPFGVWAVTGNHEFYAGADRCVRLFKEAGFRVLRDEAAEVAPGLVFAGVDDLSARRQYGLHGQFVEAALTNRPAGATVLLSHSPWQAGLAAQRGVGLMLSGHTHNGQIWPFGYLVKLQYALLGGRYQVNGMTAIVCRGTGTWGPRMRLWHSGELLRITLRSSK